MVLGGAIADYQYFRYGDHLSISGNNGTVAVETVIEGFFGQSGQQRVERFDFADGSYAASYIEYLANGGNAGGTCYDQFGQVYFCNPYAMPVIIDLDGLGVVFSDASTSNVAFDVNGDGRRNMYRGSQARTASSCRIETAIGR